MVHNKVTHNGSNKDAGCITLIAIKGVGKGHKSRQFEIAYKGWYNGTIAIKFKLIEISC